MKSKTLRCLAVIGILYLLLNLSFFCPSGERRQRLSNISKYLSTHNPDLTALYFKFWAKSLLTDIQLNVRIGFATVFNHRRLPCTSELGTQISGAPHHY